MKFDLVLQHLSMTMYHQVGLIAVAYTKLHYETIHLNLPISNTGTISISSADLHFYYAPLSIHIMDLIMAR